MDSVGEGSSGVVDCMVSHGGGVHKRSWECGCELKKDGLDNYGIFCFEQHLLVEDTGRSCFYQHGGQRGVQEEQHGQEGQRGGRRGGRQGRRGRGGQRGG